jgi:hypothetical protein
MISAYSSSDKFCAALGHQMAGRDDPAIVDIVVRVKHSFLRS